MNIIFILAITSLIVALAMIGMAVFVSHHKAPGASAYIGISVSSAVISAAFFGLHYRPGYEKAWYTLFFVGACLFLLFDRKRKADTGI